MSPSDDRIPIVVGGIAYNLMVDARHAETMIAIAAAAPTYGIELAAAVYRHTSVVPQGRADWLERACSVDGATWGVSIDSDTWIDPPLAWALPAFLRRHTAELPVDVCAIGFVVPQRDNVVNAWRAPGERVRREDVTLPWFDVHGVGAAVMAYHLPSYRRLGPELVRRSFAVVPDAAGGFVGEDLFHCRFVAAQGLRIVASTALATVHGARLQ